MFRDGLDYKIVWSCLSLAINFDNHLSIRTKNAFFLKQLTSTQNMENSKKKVGVNKRHWPIAVDLYCGCGSVTEGLKRRNVRVVASVDNCRIACETYRANHPTVNLYETDIRNLDPNKIKQNDLQGRPLDLLVVCAPCQPFSSQNKKQSQKDIRRNLILEGIRFAEVLEPRVIFFENVAGLMAEKNRIILKHLKNKLQNIGYKLSAERQIDSADYGVPQRRVRCIMMAHKVGAVEAPDFPYALTPKGQRVTVRHAIGSLKRLNSGEVDENDDLHYARNHQKIALERLKYIPKDGGDRFSLPPHLELNCHKNTNAFPDVYGRLSWDKVAATLTTGCTDVTKGRFAHPDDDRAITLREASLLQTFPNSYKFRGNTSEIATQIGNAVPSKVIEAFVPSIREALKALV